MVVGGERGWDAGPLANELHDESLSFWWKPRSGAARVVWGVEKGFPATAFDQSSPATMERLRLRAKDCLGDLDGKVAWDLYGGVGDMAEMMAGVGARVWSVERGKSAVDWGERNGSRGVTRLAGLVEETLARLPEPEVVVVNPPRVGLHERVTAWLERWARGTTGRRLVYVSCDPATLARDLTRMPSLGTVLLEAYDLFPQTAHVETLMLMETE